MVNVPKEVTGAFPARAFDVHKYTAGSVSIVGGSTKLIHAPVLSALGARAAGAGIIRMVVPDASRFAAGMLVPEATFVKQTPTCVLPKTDVTAIGMGLGSAASVELLMTRFLSGSAGRFVIDADALNVIANWYADKSDRPPTTPGQTLVLTPHGGEAARLLACKAEDVNSDREWAIRELVNRYQAIVVLKGDHTLVGAPSGLIWKCPTGNACMALAGMGDMLSGVIAARWARLMHTVRFPYNSERVAFEATCAAVWLHSAASDAIVNAEVPGDPSVVETARMIGSLRVQVERAAAAAK